MLRSRPGAHRRWVADVLLTPPWADDSSNVKGRVAAEIQLSPPQAPEEYLRRSRRYLDDGVRPVWLVGPGGDSAPRDRVHQGRPLRGGPRGLGRIPRRTSSLGKQPVMATVRSPIEASGRNVPAPPESSPRIQPASCPALAADNKHDVGARREECATTQPSCSSIRAGQSETGMGAGRQPLVDRGNRTLLQSAAAARARMVPSEARQFLV